MKQIRLFLMGNYAMQFMERSLRKAAKLRHTDINILAGEYNTIDSELIDPDSTLYGHQPDFIIWHESTLAVRDQFYNTALNERSQFADDYLARIQGHLRNLSARSPGCHVIFPNHSLKLNDNVFGHFGNALTSSWHFQVSKIDYLLNQLAAETDQLIIMNSCPDNGFGPVTDHTLAVTADLHFTIPYIDWLSGNLLQIVESRKGRFHKCLIMDLDNTLWGGIIGDDGMHGIQIGAFGAGKAFTRLQKWIRELGKRGVILAVCSKNEDVIAREPFQKHPEMVLSLDDISVFVANWESKSDNIARIREVLNIGFDSMVFIDDNPAEREIVRKHLPEVTVPELPEDPALYLPFLTSLNLFETASFDSTDQERTRQYQEESQRQQLASQVTDMNAFLESLNMKGDITCFKESDIERISQLSLRSNQFNLRTIRYQTTEIRQMLNNPEFETFSVTLSDKFGHYGLISLVIVRIGQDGTGFIDTWLMSCRVLKRTVEAWLMNHIADRLKERGVGILYGEYLLTSKNKLVADLLPKLGFETTGECTYQLELNKYSSLHSNIKDHEHHY